MSNKYKHGDRVPNNVLCARLEELATAVTKGSSAINREFTMRVPAELDRDADLILSQAAQRIREPSEVVITYEVDGTWTEVTIKIPYTFTFKAGETLELFTIPPGAKIISVK